ncbi:hypothetical protein PoB_001657200 [Plakobranchus ocellatus]|uniref:Uncharacterized protein n=1 Tax=Plakobranchus ocellatus TaxID=259542 RepID=A0AAV3Z696_9GAST|nr:hypothetical protein PoB_001657200 [Plakobranchus ocellatus]
MITITGTTTPSMVSAFFVSSSPSNYELFLISVARPGIANDFDTAYERYLKVYCEIASYCGTNTSNEKCLILRLCTLERVWRAALVGARC